MGIGNRALELLALHRRQLQATEQGVVKQAPAPHHLRRAPAVHQHVVELDRQAVQGVAAMQQSEAPRRAGAQIKRFADARTPPVAHRLSRIGGLTQIDAFELWRQGGQQALRAVGQRGHAQHVGFFDQVLQGALEDDLVQRAFDVGTAADVQVSTARPGHLIGPNFFLRQAQRQHAFFGIAQRQDHRFPLAGAAVLRRPGGRRLRQTQRVFQSVFS